MKKTIITISTILILFASCDVKEIQKEMAKSMIEGQKLFAADNFHKAIGFIELHKLRSGHYPESLDDLNFLSAMDSLIYHYVSYEKIDTGYILNLTSNYTSMKGESDVVIRLKYPDEFWAGLGCIESNAME